MKGYPQVYEFLSNEDYHAGPGLSKSDLDKIHRSPAFFKSVRVAPQKPTKAMEFGTAVHTAILEPQRFRVSTCPAAADIAEAIRANPTAAMLLAAGQAELSVFAELSSYKGMGTLSKCRPDWYNNELNVIVDIKTTRDASRGPFAASIAKYRYDVQEAYYRDVWEAAKGRKINAFYFIAVETTPPYPVAIYELDEDSVRIGRIKYTRDLDLYCECVKTGDFTSPAARIEKISLPDWARREYWE